MILPNLSEVAPFLIGILGKILEIIPNSQVYFLTIQYLVSLHLLIFQTTCSGYKYVICNMCHTQHQIFWMRWLDFYKGDKKKSDYNKTICVMGKVLGFVLQSSTIAGEPNPFLCSQGRLIAGSDGKVDIWRTSKN